MDSAPLEGRVFPQKTAEPLRRTEAYLKSRTKLAGRVFVPEESELNFRATAAMPTVKNDGNTKSGAACYGGRRVRKGARVEGGVKEFGAHFKRRQNGIVYTA